MDLGQVVSQHFKGNWSAFARAMGVSNGCVHLWKRKLPAARAAQIELWIIKNTTVTPRA